MSDALETALRDLARELRVPEPSAALSSAVLARVRTEGVPSAAPASPGQLAGWLRAKGRWLVAILVAALMTVVAVSPVGAQVADWFGFHGVLVTEGARNPSGTPTVPPADGNVPLHDAATLVGFAPRVPEDLGQPDAVTVSADRRLLSLTWGTENAVRLDEFDGTIAPEFWKASRDSTPVEVGEGEGLWFPTPHEVVVLAGDGAEQTIAPRLAAQTLIWTDGDVTLRLEGALSLGRALGIARSVG